MLMARTTLKMSTCSCNITCDLCPLAVAFWHKAAFGGSSSSTVYARVVSSALRVCICCSGGSVAIGSNDASVGWRRGGGGWERGARVRHAGLPKEQRLVTRTVIMRDVATRFHAFECDGAWCGTRHVLYRMCDAAVRGVTRASECAFSHLCSLQCAAHNHITVPITTLRFLDVTTN